MHAKVFSATPIGVEARCVDVEVDISPGLVNFYIVGLPDTAIKESSKRISTAFKNSGIKIPTKKITVNLAPADLKKEGALFDLPIAVGVLCAANLVTLSPSFIQETLFVGELALDGTIRSIKGSLALASAMARLQKKRIIVPADNAREAALVMGIEVIGVAHIVELVSYLRQEITIEPMAYTLAMIAPTKRLSTVDFADVKGQMQAKRALQIAAAGRHNILFIGPPGAGKTMLAQRLATIMPPMTNSEILETNKVYSISGKLQIDSLIRERPFRAPHHTISQAGLIGGGSFPQPGEISLAHHGILFLDELTEFRRTVIESLRQPLENKNVCIARANQTITFPANPLFVVALNPCPCGYWSDKKRPCVCSALAITKYLRKLSGPFLDRIDLQINVQALEYDSIKDKSISAQSSDELCISVMKAVAIQEERLGQSLYNSAMSPSQVDTFCVATAAAEQLIKKAFDRLGLSMRGYHKVMKVARTIADLEGDHLINEAHIHEAILYRSLDQYREKIQK